MNINKFIDHIMSNCSERGLKKYQVVYSYNQDDSLSVFQQKVLKNSSLTRGVITISVIVNGKLGKFTTEKFVEDDINLMVKQAIMNAEIVDHDDEVFFSDGDGEYKTVTPYEPLKDKLKSLDKVQFLRELESHAYNADKRVINVISSVFVQSKSKTIMKNSLGLDLSEENISAFGYINVGVSENGETKTGGYLTDFSSEESFSPAFVANKAVDKALAKLGAISVSPQKEKVIIENHAFSSLLQSIAPIFSSYSVDRGYSKLRDKLGNIIASSKVTILDNPHLEGGYATTSFDGDGVPTQDKVVVNEGRLETFLYNLSMAHKFNTESTGNGTGGLGTRTFNFYLSNGDKSMEDLLRILDNGVYINGFNGLHAGLNIISGDFSLGADGFLVSNGKLSKALQQFTVSGNIYELLKNIVEVGDDLEFYGKSVGSPSIIVAGLTLG